MVKEVDSYMLELSWINKWNKDAIFFLANALKGEELERRKNLGWVNSLKERM